MFWGSLRKGGAIPHGRRRSRKRPGEVTVTESSGMKRVKILSKRVGVARRIFRGSLRKGGAIPQGRRRSRKKAGEVTVTGRQVKLPPRRKWSRLWDRDLCCWRAIFKRTAGNANLPVSIHCQLFGTSRRLIRGIKKSKLNRERRS